MLDCFNTLFRYRDKKSPDKLGLYPEAVHIEAMPERRYLWTSRVLVIFSAMSFCLTIMLACAIYVLLPQRGARPQLVEVKSFMNRLGNVEPLEKKVSGEDLLTEQLIEKYIKLRHEVPESQAELMYRWGTDSEFYWLSSVGVYQAFARKATRDLMEEFIKQGLRRKVEIEYSHRLTPNLWVTQFHTVNTTEASQKLMVTIWRAYIRVKYEDYEDLDMEDPRGMVQNPYGFKVTRYSLAYVGSPEKSEHYLETAKQVSEHNYRY